MSKLFHFCGNIVFPRVLSYRSQLLELIAASFSVEDTETTAAVSLFWESKQLIYFLCFLQDHLNDHCFDWNIKIRISVFCFACGQETHVLWKVQKP